MTKFFSAAAAMLCLLLLPVASAQAQASRTWVSGVGDDINPCSRTAPCKTFPGAIAKTARGGEINMLDSGGFGAVTINKSISIVADGLLGGVLVASTDAIIINITDPTDAGMVNLDGLDIEGLGATGSPGINGINILSAKSVTINKSRIRGFRAGTGAGININPTTAKIEVLISNTSITGGLVGVRAQSDGNGNANVMMDRVNISNVGQGIAAGPKTVVRVGNSVVTGADAAFVTTSNGKIFSFGTNMVAGNTVAANDKPTALIPLR